MTTYKFLGAQRQHPFTGVPMPEPGTWFDAGHQAADGPDGIRACSASDLAHWIDTELWQIELTGEVSIETRSVVAGRARLLGPIDTWTADVARELAATCAWRARQVVADGLTGAGFPSVAAQLMTSSTLDELAVLAAAIEHQAPAGWSQPIGLVAEAAREAPHARVATAVLTATVAVAGWDEALQDAERRWQSAWISDRLGLRRS